MKTLETSTACFKATQIKKDESDFQCFSNYVYFVKHYDSFILLSMQG